jgi:hypothetical protein
VGITIIGSRYDSYGVVTNTLLFEFETHGEQGFVEYHKDTVRVFGGWGFGRKYIFPLAVGKKWGFDYGSGGDSVNVVSLDSLSVPAGRFAQSFLLYERAYQIGPVANYYTKTWFVPRIGIIKMHTYGGSSGPREISVVWTLLKHIIVT